MPKLVVLDPGHGGGDPGAVGHGLKEKELVLEICRIARTRLERDFDVKVALTRTDNETDMSLDERARFANARRAAAFVSVHINAAAATTARGFETYRHTGDAAGSPAGRLQAFVHGAVLDGIRRHGVIDRREKSANFAVLRLTRMPHLLTENLFISNRDDAALLRQRPFLSAVAEAHALGIARALGLSRKDGSTTDTVADAVAPQQLFLDWVEWRRRGAKRKERPQGVPRPIPESWWTALKRLEQAFTGEKPEPTTGRTLAAVAPAATGAVTVRTKLLARPRVTRKALERYMLARAHGRYSDDDVRTILTRYIGTSKAVGLDPLLVVSQMVLETGNLRSHWSQRPRRNPAGIGVTGEPGVGISFPSWDKAVRAHVGRLLAYAIPKGEGTAAQRELIDEALAWRSLPDDRRGRAPTLEGLAGTWAADARYADKIARVANEIRGAA